jgi:hypothetical protein
MPLIFSAFKGKGEAVPDALKYGRFALSWINAYMYNLLKKYYPFQTNQSYQNM